MAAKRKIVLAAELEDSKRLAVYVDQGRPGAWRDEPFFSTLKEYAIQFAPIRAQVVVYIGQRAIVILPDREVDLGIVGDDKLIVTGERSTPFGVELDAFKLKKNDPLAQQFGLK